MVKKNTIGIQDIAKRAGVSIASVSQAYRNPKRVSSKVRERILAAAKAMNFTPKFIQKRIEYGNVGVLIDLTRGPFGEFYAPVIAGILSRANELKWNISIETYDSHNTQFPPMITQKRVDGIILLSKHADDYIAKLIERKIPFCIADYVSPKIKHNAVISDWYTGAYLATEHLIKNGHQRIAMIHSSMEKGKVSVDRLAGFKAALKKRQLTLPEDYLLNGNFSYQTAKEQCQKLFMTNPRPTAVFCATDVMALGAYTAANMLGLKIPQEISVIGFDNIELPYYMEPLTPGLTTIAIDKQRIGAEALNMVHRQIITHTKELETKILPVHLIERGSVRKIV